LDEDKEKKKKIALWIDNQILRQPRLKKKGGKGGGKKKGGGGEHDRFCRYH